MKKVLLFDFDGVIVDTFEMALAFHPEVGVKMSRRRYRDVFMGNIYDHVRAEVLDKDFDAHHKKWFELYTRSVVDIEPNMGIDDAVRLLAKQYVMVIVTSSESYSVKKYLAKYNLTKFFDGIYGADVHHSKVYKINMVMREYKLTVHDCVFITDTAGDIYEAHACDVKSIGVLWGFHSRYRLLQAKPWALARTPSDLVSKIETFFNKKS